VRRLPLIAALAACAVVEVWMAAGTPARAAMGGLAEQTGATGSALDSRSESSVAPSPADTTPPVTVASGAGSRWRRTAATVRLAATDDASGVAATYFSLDGAAFARGTRIVVRAPADHNWDGVHVIAFYSTDNAGNVEGQQQATVKIDTTPPRFRWRGVEPAIIHRQQTVRLSFAILEATGRVRMAVAVIDQYGSRVLRVGGLRRASGLRAYDLALRYRNGVAFMPGVYRVRFIVTDEAGNHRMTSLRPFRDYRPVTAKVWYSVPPAGRRVALTFDDGAAGPWASILSTLKAHGAHATFFLLGPCIEASPGLLRRAVADGNALGSHGCSHTLMTGLSWDQVIRELVRSEAPCWEAARVSPVPYVRPPYGAVNATTVAAAGSIGFARIVLWDVDPQDWTRPGAAVIAQRVLDHLHPGAIVCLHTWDQTAAALPAILSGMRARGYRAVSLPELFRAAGYR
jgi:peptidoglycan-N-acetylglucosamine deacetylase